MYKSSDGFIFWEILNSHAKKGYEIESLKFIKEYQHTPSVKKELDF